MKHLKLLPLQFLTLFSCQTNSQDRDISYMTSGGKIHPLQANIDLGITQ